MRQLPGPTCLAFSMLAVGSLWQPGCTTAPAIAVNSAVDPAGRVPPDLAVEVTVVPGGRVEGRVRIEERPAKLVLLPDGSLHGACDRVPPDGTRPARVRRLGREQMADVWSALESAGFADAALADTRAGVRAVEANPNDARGAHEVLVTVEVQADGARFAFVRRFSPGSDGEPAIRRIVRTLAALAWMSDEPLAEGAELPTRYDLGPDPYARYAPATPSAGGSGR